MTTLNSRIRNSRNNLHLSQEYVANYLGIGRSAMVDIESGKRKVTADELNKLSKLFLIPTDELLNGKNTSKPSQVFARSFEDLDEKDQAEIMNLIEFKLAMKDRA
jgi:transcriptional regulator with XRE-family HTH domain